MVLVLAMAKSIGRWSGNDEEQIQHVSILLKYIFKNPGVNKTEKCMFCLLLQFFQ